ncbi:T9SS type A sorting domain-containing protein [Ancylomarina sp. YFZ004]
MRGIKGGNKLVLICLFTSVFNVSNAQEVISTGGNSHKTETLQLSWTLGELSIQTIDNSNLILTQGLHQSLIEIEKVDTGEEFDIDLIVYPNPTKGKLHLIIKRFDELHSLKYSICDIKGVVIKRETIVTPTTEISLHGLSSAVYFLKVFAKESLIQTFKIVKY